MPQNGLLLSSEEIRILAKFILDIGYISYDNEKLHAVVDKIIRADNELDRIPSIPTP